MKLFRITILPLLLLLAGCKVDIDRNVLFIGDSLIEQSFPEISRELLLDNDRGYFLMTNAVWGAAFSSDVQWGAYNRARAPRILASHAVDYVVISFGTNDAHLNTDPANRQSQAQMRIAAGALMDAYVGRPILWILPHDRVREVYGDEIYGEVVAAITEAASTRPNVRLIDFTAYVASKGLSMTAVCLPADYHLNDTGNQLWAQMIHTKLSLN